MPHQGRVRATDERRYVVGFCAGTLTVEPDRLVIQGEPHDNGRDRKPTVLERAEVVALHVKCGLFGTTVKRQLPSGYRADVIRVRGPATQALIADLATHAWPTAITGPRRPR